MHCSGSGGGSRRNLVIGAQLQCTKCNNHEETSLFMTGNARALNNAMFGGLLPGTRRNRVKEEDIIPFAYCQKTRSNGNRFTCCEVMITDDYWENLTLPFDEIKIPHINFTHYFRPEGILPYLVRAIPAKSLAWSAPPPPISLIVRTEISVTDLNEPSHEHQFLENYGQQLRGNNSRNHGRVLADDELRHRANLRVHTDERARENAVINMNSILLCKGYGGIIHPKTDGQRRSYEHWAMVEWVTSLPHDMIWESTYQELARYYLTGMTLDERVRFISLLFDCSGEIVLRDGMSRFLARRTVWNANEHKFENLLDAMSNLIGTPGYMSVDIQNMHTLLDLAQGIERPLVLPGESAPNFSIIYDEGSIIRADGPIPFFRLDFEGYRTNIFSAVDMMASGRTQSYEYVLTSNRMDMYLAADSLNSELSGVSALSRQTGHLDHYIRADMAEQAAERAIAAFIRDAALGWADHLLGTAVGTVVGVAEGVADIIIGQVPTNWPDAGAFNARSFEVASMLGLSRAVAVFSENGRTQDIQFRFYPTMSTPENMERLGIPHVSPQEVIARVFTDYNTAERFVQDATSVFPPP